MYKNIIRMACDIFMYIFHKDRLGFNNSNIIFNILNFILSNNIFLMLL